MEAGLSQRRVSTGERRSERMMERPRAEMSATEEYMLPALGRIMREYLSWLTQGAECRFLFVV
jgi:hypothetical protein